MTNWKSWHNEADIPMQDKDGNWYDAETGIYFNQKFNKPAKAEKPAQHEKMTLKLDEMKADAQRVIMQEQYLDRFPNAEVRQAKAELIDFAKSLLARNAKKADYCKMYDMRKAVSQLENAYKK